MTIKDLLYEIFPIKTNLTEIRDLVRQLSLEGVPIVLSLEPPRYLYYAANEEELREWTEAMFNLCLEVWERKCEIERILKMKNQNRGEA